MHNTHITHEDGNFRKKLTRDLALRHTRTLKGFLKCVYLTSISRDTKQFQNGYCMVKN